MGMDIKELRAAVKELNVVLIDDEKDKIKVVGSKKVDIVAAFTEAVEEYIEEAGDDVADVLPETVVDFYNEYCGDEEEAEEEEKKPAKKKPAKKKPGKKAPAKKKDTAKKTEGKTSAKRAPSESIQKRKAMMAKLISTGKYTKVEIVEKVSEKFTDVKAVTIATSIQDGTNPKYNKFDSLVVVDKDKKVSFKK